MLVAVVFALDFLSIESQIKKALKYTNLIELRLDYLKNLDFKKIKKLKEKFLKTSFIFTLRRKDQGGFYKKNERKRYQDIEKLISLNPKYFDLEYDIDSSFIKKLHLKYPKVKLILSYHEFIKTPDFFSILQSMQRKDIFLYKIAVKENSSLDALKMLFFIKKANCFCNFVGISLGKNREFSRVLGKIFGNKFTYGFVDEKIIDGQLSLNELVNAYNFKSIDKDTKIFALIGDPIEQSIGHVFHNERFKKQNRNAVYVKIRLKKEELSFFFSIIKKLPFRGLSVTMPLKEEVVKYLNEDLSVVGIVNTILIKNKKLIGFNTDGKAALDIIEKRFLVKNKKIVIIGAGSTAKAIGFEAIKRKASVIIINRTKKRALEISKVLGCEGFGIEDFEKVQDYDVLINATSSSMQNILPIDPKFIYKNKLVLDVVTYPKLTPFLKEAKKKNCEMIFGEEMFIAQAKMQFKN
jgi:3-dehydroquinate dehydratase / shikimate dehydrogenase